MFCIHYKGSQNETQILLFVLICNVWKSTMSANEQRAVISIELYLYLVAIQRIPYLKSFNSSEIKQGTKYKVFFNFLVFLYF